MFFSAPHLIYIDVPLVRQKRDGECLAACSAMVLAHLDIHVRYDRLIWLLNTVPLAGAAFSGIQNLERMGIAIAQGRGGLEALYQRLLAGELPIVPVVTTDLPHWPTDNIRHALVIAGMDASRAYVFDPAFDLHPIRVPLGDLDLARIEFDEVYAVLTRE